MAKIKQNFIYHDVTIIRMAWKKLLDSKDLIAYEKSSSQMKVHLEARFKNNRWIVYKTYNFLHGTEWINHVKEYTAASTSEAKQLLITLQKEDDIQFQDLTKFGPIAMQLKRCYKEDFVEKWKFSIDQFSDDNFVIVRYDSEIKLDIVLHDVYDHNEKEILDKVIESLGLREISDTIQYEFFYFKKHSAKRRVYRKKQDQTILAQMEYTLNRLDDAN